MPFLALSITCNANALDAYETILNAHGAMAITLLDQYAATDLEQAILEPAPGQTPVWEQITLQALFAGETDAITLLSQLHRQAPQLSWHTVHFHHLADQAWTRIWLDQYQPIAIGQTLWIVPWSQPIPPHLPEGAAVVRLDPGLAFGSGTHPTTALCLHWLADLARKTDLTDQVMMDIGCGSGILAIAALKLGAASVIAIDNDPQARLATLTNAQRNAVADRIIICDTLATVTQPCHIAVANILAQTLTSLADDVAQLIFPNGRLALSGLLRGQESALIARYFAQFADLRCQYDGDWVAVTGTRRTCVTEQCTHTAST